MTAQTMMKGFLLVLLLYFLYIVVTAVVLFYFLKEKEEDRPIKHISAYMGEKESTVDRVLLLEDGYESGLARMRMIQPSIQSILLTTLLEKENLVNLFLEPCSKLLTAVSKLESFWMGFLMDSEVN